MRVLAFDISKGKSYVVLYDEQICVDEFEVYHNQDGFNHIKKIVHEVETEVVFEATGVYSQPLEALLQSEGIAYYKMNPLLAKMQTQTLRSNKTDQVDAHKLAQSHYKFEREISKSQPRIYSELKDISGLYREIQNALVKEKNHLHAALQKVFPELEVLYSSSFSKFTLNLIEKYPHPNIVLKSSRTKIKNQILLSTKKKISQEQAKEKAEELIEMAKKSYPSVDDKHFSVTKVQIRVKMIRDSLEMKELLAKKMITLATELTEFQVLTSIPGIGNLSAALIISELGDIHRFATSNKMNAYVGIDIRTYQSGTIQKRDRINKRGNARARMILFFVVRNMLRKQKVSPNHIVDYYYKMREQPFNKQDKVAMVACMNKLLKVIHFLVNNTETYDYTKSAHS